MNDDRLLNVRLDDEQLDRKRKDFTVKLKTFESDQISSLVKKITHQKKTQIFTSFKETTPMRRPILVT